MSVLDPHWEEHETTEVHKSIEAKLKMQWTSEEFERDTLEVFELFLHLSESDLVFYLLL